MKSVLIVLLIIVLVDCKPLQDNHCEAINVESMRSGTRNTPVGSIHFEGIGIHDTTAIDLLMHITDMDSGQPVANASSEIISVQKLPSDSTGLVNFIGFYHSGGTFNIKISHPNYNCILIDRLSFSSGQIIRMEAKLKRRE